MMFNLIGQTQFVLAGESTSVFAARQQWLLIKYVKDMQQQISIFFSVLQYINCLTV